MAIALIGRIDPAGIPTWEFVTELFSEWEQLLAHRGVLDGEREMGLWWELWCLSRSKRLEDLLEAWRGRESSHVDFLLDGRAFEVKATRRAGVHQVSQQQVDEPYGDAKTTFVSLFVTLDPLRGITLPELVHRVNALATNIGSLEQKLAATGYCHDDAQSYVNKFALLEAPLFFPAGAIPRVRLADPGVSRMRYHVELDRLKSLSGSERDATIAALGIESRTMEYPCV